jgi:exopolyphosphatase / guanosine-5'-triphosphate,3'-diphosphate pyrophosphatase
VSLPIENSRPEPARHDAAVRLVAVIDLGTTSARMAIAQIAGDGTVTPLESLQQAVSLGKDTFTTGSIQRNTIEECANALRSFRRVLDQYRITEDSQIRAVATSAVREASNREAFLDRIYIATGISVEAINEADTNRITYLAVRDLLLSDPAFTDGETLVVEVGGGNTEALLLKRGQVAYSHNYHLGSLRLREVLEDYGAPVFRLPEIMEIHIDRAVKQIQRRLSLKGSPNLLALGGDVRFAVSRLVPDWDNQPLVKLPVSKLSRFASQVVRLSVDELVRRYHLTFPDAETLGPAVLIYTRLAQALRLKQLLVSTATLRDGLMLEMAYQGSWSEQFDQQVIYSALQIGWKYDFDQRHAEHVAQSCRVLFGALASQHRLPPRFERILTISALLHDIGLFISNRSHHKHSMYLIMNSDLFGLGARDLQMVALVARYHRRAFPRPTHDSYVALDRESRVAVLKMAAILRVADALDAGHNQQVRNVKAAVEPEGLIITVSDSMDLTLERHALQYKGQMFEQVFGMPIRLRENQGV